MKAPRFTRFAFFVCAALVMPLGVGGAQVASVEGGMVAPAAETPPAPFFWRQEAEEGVVTSPMAIGVDYGASVCEYVYSPGNTGSVSWTIDVPVGSDYHLWVRAMGLSWTNNSFWISVDGEEPFHYEIPNYSGEWTWGWAGTHPLSLMAGSHILTVGARESMARLDSLVLTNDASYWPAIITPCDLTPTPSATPQASPTPFPSPTPILEARNLTLIDQIGGSQRALMAQGERLYVGLGMRLEVVDISDPLCPRPVGRTEPLGDPVQAVYVSGHYAFVAAEDGGLHIVDVSDPTAPRGVGRYWLPWAKDVTVAGHHAFVMASDGMYVLDVADPSSPSLVGVYHYEWRDRWRSPWVRISGQYAFAYVDYVLRILDVSNPSAPIQVGEIPTIIWAGFQDLYIDGSHAYLVHDYGYRVSLRVLDISNPLTPVETGYCLLAEHVWVNARAVHAWGDYVCVIMDCTSSTPGPLPYVALAVVNVSDPGAPAVLSTVAFRDAGGLAGDVWLAQGAAFLALEGETLQVVDLADPAHPVAVTGCVLPAWRAQDVDAAPGHAFVAGGIGGLAIVDTSDPAQVAQVSQVRLDHSAELIAGADQAVCVGSNWYEHGFAHYCAAIDVSNPALPVELWESDHWWRLDALSASGGIAYSTMYHGWRSLLWAFHVRSGAWGGACYLNNTGDTPTRLSVARDYAYVVSPDTGLQVLGVSTENLHVVTTLRLPDTNDVCLVADRAYLAGDDLLIVDVSDPEHPTVAATRSLPGQAHRVDIDGRHAYVATDMGLYVLDLADPLHPVEVASYHGIVGVRNISAVDSYLHVAAGESGLFVLRVGPEPSVTPTPTATHTPTATPTPTPRGFSCLPVVLKGR